MKKPLFNTCLFFLVFVCLTLCFGARAARSEAGLRAGAAERIISPAKPVYLAGCGQNRVSTSVHDDLYAHCLYLAGGGLEVTIVSLDLLGLLLDDVRAVRELLRNRGFDPGGVFIAGTHTHTAPALYEAAKKLLEEDTGAALKP